jgi:two-component system phosphate regulon sensor histidine kinase PhoR
MDYLDGILKEELAIRGINSQIPSYRYHYGIYGFEKGSFVILDGKKFNYEEEKENILPEYVNTGNENTAFRVNVFPRERPVPGELRIFFPNKNAIILRSLGKTLSATLFFAGIILVCFGYTLYIIFTQKKLSEMKTDFINNMTHEFKTPIATISLAADSLNNPTVLKNEDKILRFSRIIKQENIRMHKQVEKVLQMALLEKKDFNLKWASINMHDLIQAAIENISLQVEAREGSVQGFLNAASPVVKGDQTHLSNIINNLLDNANKYSPQKPHITVFTRNVDKGLEIIVKDEGIGLARDVRKFIFDKFYRVPTGNIHNVKGFGLGLSYVKTMVEAHKGKIDVRSELGKGSSFILFFPLH